VSQAVFFECQSNDLQLVTWLYQYTFNIHSDVILFEDSFVSNLNVQDVIFRRRTGNDIIFEHTFEPVGDYVLESNGKVIATGGFLLHYNFPFADLFVEVKEEFQRKGIGSFLTQELKRECYLAGRVPSARCNMDNFASKATMLKAGYRISGFMLLGRIKSGKV
jgi:RimJ/RimL family protein N-acetyltransferase